MTTASTTTRVRHDSDANFREWATEFHDKLVAVGCVQTADTGQMNFTTVTRAGTNADAGYSIYYMNDAMHATAPIYFKIYWGTGATTSRGRIRLEVGTGSNGTGSITNPSTAYTESTTVASDWNTDTTYSSYWCLANGCLSVFQKVGRPAADFALQGFIICRSTDANGTADANGFVIIHHNNASAATTFPDIDAFRYAAATWNTRQTSGSFAVLNLPSSTTGVNANGDTETQICHYLMDRVRPMAQMLAVCTGDLTKLNSYTLTPMGVTSRTYLHSHNALGYLAASMSSPSASGSFGLLTIYE